jgi:hypothetical protein
MSRRCWLTTPPQQYISNTLATQSSRVTDVSAMSVYAMLVDSATCVLTLRFPVCAGRKTSCCSWGETFECSLKT